MEGEGRSRLSYPSHSAPSLRPARPTRVRRVALLAIAALAAAALSLRAGPSRAASVVVRAGDRCTSANIVKTATNGALLRCQRTAGGFRWQVIRPGAPTATTPGTAALAASGPGNPASCVTQYEPTRDYFPDKATILEAVNLRIRYARNYKVVTVSAASPNGGSAVYVLVQCGTPAPKLDGDLTGATVVNVPITNAAVLSPAAATGPTVAVPAFDVAGAADKVVALGDPRRYATPSIVERVKAGHVKTVGVDNATDVGLLVGLKPSVVIADTPTATRPAPLNDQLRAAGLTVVTDASSTETTPLGRAEWVKLVGTLTNSEKAVEGSFGKVRADYNALSARALAAGAKTVVISGAVSDGSWRMPGGRTVAAQLLRDAGGSYPWATDPSSGVLSLDADVVLDKAFEASAWIDVGDAWKTLAEAKRADERYATLLAYNVGNVWANDKRLSASGANDVNETAAVRPDLLLADLVSVLQPSMLPSHVTTWLRRVPAQ